MYDEKVNQYAKRYGPRCWPLIYQVDVKTRMTHAPRVRRRLAEEKELALKEGRRHPYNPLRPWEEVFVQLCTAETTWWNDELVEPCQFITNNVAAVSDYVTGLAPVASSGAAASTAAYVPSSTTSPPPDQHAAITDATRQRRTTNNKNAPICSGFTEGKCLTLDKKSRCSHDGKSVHQCCWCLSNQHGGNACPQRPQAGGETQPRKGKTGGGKRRRVL